MSLRPIRLLRGPLALLLSAATLALSAAATDAAPSPSPTPVAKAVRSTPGPAPKAVRNAPTMGFSITLSAAQTALVPGNSTTLTATANQTVSGSGMSIEIFDLSGILINACNSGATCTATVSQVNGAIVDYAAFVMVFSSNLPSSGNFAAESNPVEVSWLTVSLTVSARVVPLGTQVTMTAVTRADILGLNGSGALGIQIFDVTSGSRVANCLSGIVCSATVTQSSSTEHLYQAFVAVPGTTLPLQNILARSGAFEEAWGQIDLQVSNGAVATGTSVTLTATASINVGPTPDFIEIFDATTGTEVGSALGAGTVLSVSVSQNAPGTHQYIAFVSDDNSTFTPNFHLSSIGRPVVWG
jgi:hypothetical protein